MFARTDLRYLDQRWHEKGRDARRTTSDLDAWSDQDIERWDLDEPSREPTGQRNPRTWQHRKPLRTVNESDSPSRIDVRELEDR